MTHYINREMKQPLYALVTGILIAAAVFSAIWAVGRSRELRARAFPDVTVLERGYPVSAGKDGRRNVYVFKKARPAHWRSLPQISSAAVSAVLMSEDAGFYGHQGYEPEAIRGAFAENLKAGRIVRGGSTITQQVVKNLFLTPEKTLDRKARELLLAVEMERRLGKRRILETYLNIAEWGPGIYGIEQAARSYFHKTASELNAREGAVLAFMLPNPKRYRHSVLGESGLTPFGAQGVSSILERLWRTGKISDEDYASAGPSAAVPSTL